MKINGINAINTNNAINKNGQKTNFKGLWGEVRTRTKFNSDSNDPVGRTEYFEKTYYPFQDESSSSINAQIDGYKNYKCEDYVTYCWTAIVGATLPILTREYNLFREGRLNSDASRIIERTIKSIVK